MKIFSKDNPLDNNELLKTSLYPREWLCIIFLMLFLILLTLASHSCSQINFEEISKERLPLESLIEVYIEGAVEKPGKYFLPKGAKVGDLITLAEVKKIADTKKLNIKKILKNGHSIKVKEIKKINIILLFPDGTLERVTVPKGTQLIDLPSFYSFKEGTDIKKIQKKRTLKEGDKIQL